MLKSLSSDQLTSFKEKLIQSTHLKISILQSSISPPPLSFIFLQGLATEKNSVCLLF